LSLNVSRGDVSAAVQRSRGRTGARLTPPWRKLLLVVHVIASVGLLGADAAVLTLVDRHA